MPEFAQFVAIRDESFVLPDPNTGENTSDFSGIDLAHLDANRTAVLAFRLRTHGRVHLTMNFNGRENCIDYEFDPAEPESTRPRSWHEIVPGSDLLTEDNALHIAATELPGSGIFHSGGGVELSDIVVFYHARIVDDEVLG